jgi:2-alkenal reductase
MKRSFMISAFLLVAVLLAACSPTAMFNTLAGKALAQSAQSNGVVAAAPAADANSVLKQVVDSSTLEEIYQRVNPSVVNIQVVTQSQNTNFAPGFPFGNRQEMPSTQSSALGSGFVWDKQGHIVTNNHVVENGTEISVMFSDGFVVPATLVGMDSNSDLAVLKVDMPADRLAPLTLAPSADVHVGQAAIAIGNPFGLEGTMTLGIISAVGRSLPVQTGISSGASYTIPNIIQTDAPINPGNSGGVLLNDQGQVVGVTNAIESTTQANAGIGFAIPSAIIEKVVPALINDGKYAYPYIGISGTTLSYNLNKAMNLSEDQRGVLVAEVTSGGPAEKAGLKGSDQQAQVNGGNVAVGGDIIVGIDGNKVNTFEEMVGYLIEKKSPGDSALLDVLRDGKNVEVTITLGTRPVQP